MGEGYKSPEAFASVLRFLGSGADGAAAVARMDRRFGSLPGFGDLEIYRRAVTLAA